MNKLYLLNADWWIKHEYLVEESRFGTLIGELGMGGRMMKIDMNNNVYRSGRGFWRKIKRIVVVRVVCSG